MNYTENYHLPQWVKTDRIMMEDFNQMCLDIEVGLAENVSGAAADNAAAVTAAQNAQATANQAVSAAAAAQAKADAAYAPDQPPYAVGSYMGTGASLAVTVGFRPRFVIVAGNVSSSTYQYSSAAGEGSALANLYFSNTGFVVSQNEIAGGGHENPPKLVDKGIVYSYIAFR